MSHPKFVVVGHPNKGKSSIVSTLTLDDSVVIGDKPGTTTKARSFKLQKDNKTFYELIDTPGFQRPRKLLKILQEGNPTASQRPKRVLEFLQKYCQSSEFKDECELLKPIMQDNSGIIYVVDASKPYSSEFENEMEILRFCAKPSMAILNYIGNSDYTKEWEEVLGQYFRIVKPFNPYRATFSDHIDLLEALSHLSPSFSEKLKESIALLKSYRDEQKNRVAELITDAIKDILGYKLIKSSHLISHNQQKLQEEFKKAIEQKEEQLFRDIANTLNFKNSAFELPKEPFEYKLFSQESKEIFGLSRDKLVLISTLTTATAGGVIDLSVGGHSFFLGTIIGGAIGFFGASYGYDELAKIKLLSNNKTQIGPIEDSNFGFILLNRAISFTKELLSRSHANRDIKPKNFISDDTKLSKLKKLHSIHSRFRDNKTNEKELQIYTHTILEEI